MYEIVMTDVLVVGRGVAASRARHTTGRVWPATGLGTNDRGR